MRAAIRGVLTGAVLASVVVGTAPAASADQQVTLDVLKVVDGDYVVETVTVPAATAASTETSLEARADVVDADVAVTYQPTGEMDPYWQSDGPGAASSVQGVWSRTRGAGQVVAVLDTAASITHEDMQGAVVPGTDIVGGAGEPWHGYGSAGVIAARAENGLGGAGMAPEAKVMPVRVCNDGGCPSAAVSRGILWAVDHGADVINMSLAGPGYSGVTAAAVLYALDHNVSVVASAGNEGLSGNPVEFPAANSGVIAVSATTPTGAPADWAVHGWQVDISTVGESVLLPLPDDSYGSGSGTSFSGPAVAGAVALLRAAHPGITVDQVQAALQAGADSTGWDRAYGAGRLDVPAAFAAADRAPAGVTATGAPGSVTVGWGSAAAGTTVRVDGTSRATASGTGATVTGLLDGNQVAVDVQPGSGARSAPVLATVGVPGPTAPVLQSANLTGDSTSSVVRLTASTAGPAAPQYSLIRDGVSLGNLTLALTSTPQAFSIGIGPMPAYETRWELRGVDPATGRTSARSNAVVAGSGRPPAPASAPTGLAAQLDNGRALLTWDDLGSAYTYRVAVAGSTVVTPVTAGAVLPAPASGTSRTYDVAALDAWGQAGPTASVTVTTPGSGAASLPAAPGGVTAVAGNGTATVSWSAAADGGSAVTGYRVTASPGGATATTTGATTATVTGLSNGTAYTFRVTATNAVGTGPVSAASAAVTPAGPPAAPSGVTVTPGDRTLAVAWNAPAANGSPVTGYRVTASPGGATATTTGALGATLTGLTNGTSYTVTVTATNAVGTGAASAGVTGTPAAPPTAPGAPSWITAVAGDGQAAVSWSAAADGGSAVTGYTVTASPGEATATTTGATTATVTGLTNGTTYTFRVTATNAVGTGPVSAASAAVTPRAPSAIAVAYQASGGSSGPLGAATGAETCGLRGGGCFQLFARGSMYWSPASGAHYLTGAVLARWAAQRWEAGPLGYPTSDTACDPVGGGCHQSFQGGSIYSSSTGGARMISGAIGTKWAASGAEGGLLGYPTSEWACGLVGGGCFQQFQGGLLYWSPAGGAHPVSGAVLGRWGAQRWETGPLGYPTSDATCGLAGGGCRQAFQGGWIYSSSAGGARVISGAIGTTWVAGGAEGGPLGYPTSEWACGLVGGGCFQQFQGGLLYWSPAGGAHPVSGPVLARWAAQRWETGPLGYPTSDPVCAVGGTDCAQSFQGGSVYTSSAGGSRVVGGAILARYATVGGPTGALGYPTSEERCGLRGGGCFQQFQGGSVYWSPASGAWPVPTPVLTAWGAVGWEAGRFGYPVGQVSCSPSGACIQPFQGGTASWTSSMAVRFT